VSRQLSSGSLSRARGISPGMPWDLERSNHRLVSHSALSSP
jgi:hypothetical protein